MARPREGECALNTIIPIDLRQQANACAMLRGQTLAQFVTEALATQIADAQLLTALEQRARRRP